MSSSTTMAKDAKGRGNNHPFKKKKERKSDKGEFLDWEEKNDD